MTKLLVYIELEAGVIAPVSYQLLGAARRLAGADGSVDALLVTEEPQDHLPRLGAADRVFCLSGDKAGDYLPEVHLKALLEAHKESRPEILLMAYSSAGLDLAAATAASADLSLVAYCQSAERKGNDLAVTSQLYAGRLLAESRVPLPALLSVIPGAFEDAEGRIEGRPETIDLTAALDLSRPRMRLLEVIEPEGGDVDIAKAERLVCVGRGIGGQDGIGEAEDLAALLGAEIAGSRPVIDAGWLPKSRQVGKSGNRVTPKLYLSLGVSGAPEHLEGMSKAAFIVAVNKDPAAPIFETAHLGSTCDLFDLLPSLVEGLKQRGC
ncbi:MAG: electron transfer flavoprotein subunit alpha/FixB family protein [Rhodospirillales bacterium]